MPDSYFLKNEFLNPQTVYCKLTNYQVRSSDIWHHHDYDELVIVRSGEGRHVTEEGTYPIHKGDTFLIPYGKSHAYENLKQLKIANILFHANGLSERCGDLANSPGFRVFFENNRKFKEKYRFHNRLTLPENSLRECETIFSRMSMEQRNDYPGKYFVNELQFYLLCTIICRSFSSEEKKRFTEISDLTRLLLFMEVHHPEPLKLIDLAKKINRSVSSLTALFHSALGESPIDYLNRIRLEHAAKELRETDHPVSRVAFSHGFADSNYFSTRFSSFFGCSPRQYRNNIRQT